MTEAQKQSEDENVDTAKVLKAVEQIRTSFDKRGFNHNEKTLIAGYLFANLLLETEDEDTHPRVTFLVGLEILNNALEDLEAGDEEEEEDEEAAP